MTKERSTDWKEPIIPPQQYTLEEALARIINFGNQAIIFGVTHNQEHCLRILVRALRQNRLRAKRLVVEGLPLLQPYLDGLVSSNSIQERQEALAAMNVEVTKLQLYGEYPHLDKIVAAAKIGGITDIKFADSDRPSTGFLPIDRERAIAQAFLAQRIDWDKIIIPEITEDPIMRGSRLSFTELGLDKAIPIAGPVWGIMGTMHGHLSTAIRSMREDHLSAGALVNALSGGSIASIDLVPGYRRWKFQAQFPDAFFFPATTHLPPEFHDWSDMYTAVRIVKI